MLMDRETILTLNRINLKFYQDHASEFSAARSQPWPGWNRLEPLLRQAWPPQRRLSVLDVGCGNARFAQFLHDRLELPFSYLGIDASSALLEHAQDRLRRLQELRPTLLSDCQVRRFDLVSGDAEEALPAGAFDLLVVFGLMHHVPGRETRAKLLTTLARGLGRAGTFIVTFWQFGAHERFQKKFRSWKSFNQASRRPLDLAQLEAGDQLVSWGEDPAAQRYCHFVSPEEAQLLLSNLKLRCLDAFSADGNTGDLNQYYLLRRC